MVTISLAVPAERDAVVELLAKQLDEHGIATAPDRIRGAVDGALSGDGRALVLVAKDEGSAVGVAYLSFIWTIEHGGSSAWLEELYVVPDRRGCGIGTALLAAVLQQAREHGCTAIDLEVDTAHRRAAHLYARQGFTPLSRERWVKVLRR